MAPITARTPLGATTTNRKWYLDVDSDTTGTAPVWTGVFGITELQPLVEGSLQDDSDFDGEGWKSQTNTANAWSLTGKVKRAVQIVEATAYDPGQEIIRKAGGSTGLDNAVHVRWYEMEPNGPRVEAYEGYAAVAWSEDGGNMEALSFVSFTLTGQGKRFEIEHPDVAVP